MSEILKTSAASRRLHRSGRTFRLVVNADLATEDLSADFPGLTEIWDQAYAHVLREQLELKQHDGGVFSSTFLPLITRKREIHDGRRNKPHAIARPLSNRSFPGESVFTECTR